MYENSKLGKCVLEKISSCLVYLANKKSSYSHFYSIIPPKDSSISYFSDISLCKGIGPLGSLHHSD